MSEYFYDRPPDVDGLDRKLVRMTIAEAAWRAIPERSLCICGHVKGVHVFERKGSTKCGEGMESRFQAIRAALEAGAKPSEFKAPATCPCPHFHPDGDPMTWLAFTARILHGFDHGTPAKYEMRDPQTGVEIRKATPNQYARARAALGWAWKQAGLDLSNPPRTYALWLADSRRVWRAWREAGSPIVVKGEPASFGPQAIPVLEDGQEDGQEGR